jgi:hypothetical protein
MATFYFNGAVDGEWTELGNWWLDDEFSVQATALPTSTDDVIASVSITSNSGSAPTVANATFNGSAHNGITITVTGLCTFNDSINNGTITGDCIFNSTAWDLGDNEGTITGNCTFNDSSENAGAVTGDCTFTGTRGNNGTITGNCTFLTEAYNGITGTITGDCTFDPPGYGVDYYVSNYGTITGDCTFYGGSRNTTESGGLGSITGNCVFNDSSSNNGYITGDCVFNDGAHNYRGESVDNIIGNCVFNDGSWNGEGINGDCVFNDGSFNGWMGYGGAGNCIFNHTSANGGSVNNAVFNDSATLYWWDGIFENIVGRVAGNCTLSVASASLTLDGWGHRIGQASGDGLDRIEGTIDIKYDKGINGSSILGVV